MGARCSRSAPRRPASRWSPAAQSPAGRRGSPTCRAGSIRAWPPRLRRPAWSGCTPTRQTRRRRRGRATRWWSRAPRAASRWRSTCRCSNAIAQDAGTRAHVPVPDQGPRPGSGAFALRALPAQPAAGDLRRRHAAGGAPPGAGLGEPALDQPGHAARRHPAGARHAGPSLCTACATWCSTRLTSTVACSARTSRTCCARLRRICEHYGSRAGVPARVGDDRQPRPGRRDAGRAAGRGDRATTGRLPRPTRGRGLEPAAARRRARHPRASTLGEAATLLAGLVARGQRTIVFAQLTQGLRAGLPVRPRGADR